jgi:SAM-dependent methyltransferase
MTPAELRDLVMGFQASRVVLSAFELGVFTAIGDGVRPSFEVAAAVAGDPRATDRLLNALVALGLLRKTRDGFANTETAAQHLVKGRRGYMGGLQHTGHMWDRWSGLTEAVRLGTAPQPAAINDRGDRWLEAFIAAMHWRAGAQADRVADMLGLEGVDRVLDVGGGSGAFTIAFARRVSSLTGVVFDLPNVVPIARRYLAEAGVADRISTVSGDYTRDPLPAGFDLAILSAIVHSNPPDVNAALVRKVADALRPRGRIALFDWVMSPDRTAPPGGTLFALNMLVGTEGGDTYTEADMREWLEPAGFGEIVRQETEFGPSLLTARI